MHWIVLLQVRAYALCDKRQSVLYIFVVLDTLAIVAFILDVTEVPSTLNSSLTDYRVVDEKVRNNPGPKLGYL